MSNSVDTYLENLQSALRLMASKTERRMILTTACRPTDPDFAEIFPTTWTELEQKGLVVRGRLKGPMEYHLTGDGWVEGVQLTATWISKEFREKAGVLSSALKFHIKQDGRKEEYAFVTLTDICQESKLSMDFVYNVIESHLLQVMYNTHDAKWADTKNHILIPRNFGLPIL